MTADIELVPFHCPKHGWVLDTLPVALVEHRCGAACAPEGEAPGEHVKKVKARRAARLRQRRKRDSGRPEPFVPNGLVGSEAPAAPKTTDAASTESVT